MDAKIDPFPQGTQRIVYVRPVPVSELPSEMQAQAEGLEKVYAVHDADGQQLALVAGKRLAFHLARENDFAPVSVH